MHRDSLRLTPSTSTLTRRPRAAGRRPAAAGPLAPLAALGVALLLVGCAAPPPPPRTIIRETLVEVPVKVPVVAPGDEAARQLLQYHERLRTFAPAELAQEVHGRDDAQLAPATAVPLALALMTSRAPGELARAQTLLDQVIRGTGPANPDWRPLAQLLSDRLAEQRRLEDDKDKLNQQLRGLQQRLDQANQKLEALKAIERSLGTPRNGTSGGSGAGAASAPASGAGEKK